MFVFRLTSELDTEFFKELDIHGRKHDRGVYLAALQLWKLLHCAAGLAAEEMESAIRISSM